MIQRRINHSMNNAKLFFDITQIKLTSCSCSFVVTIHKLHDRNVPVQDCMTVLISDCFLFKLSSVVTWNGVFSLCFSVNNGVSQGSILSPVRFMLRASDSCLMLENVCIINFCIIIINIITILLLGCVTLTS